MRFVIAVIAVGAACTSGPVPQPPPPLIARPMPEPQVVGGMHLGGTPVAWIDRWPDFARTLDAAIKEWEGKHGPMTQQELKCAWARAAAVVCWGALDAAYQWMDGDPPLDPQGELWPTDNEQISALEDVLEYWERMERAYCGDGGGGQTPAQKHVADLAHRMSLYKRWDARAGALLRRWEPTSRPHLRRPRPGCGCRPAAP